MNFLASLFNIGDDLPWWSILIFADEPKCPKNLIK